VLVSGATLLGGRAKLRPKARQLGSRKRSGHATQGSIVRVTWKFLAQGGAASKVATVKATGELAGTILSPAFFVVLAAAIFDGFEETIAMDRQPRQMTHGLRVGGIAATALAVGGLSVSALAVVPASATTSRAAKAVVVSTVKVANIGKVLASGKTVYTLKPSSTPCTAACLKVWPELVLPKGVTKAKAGTGVNASKLGTMTRAGGVRQVTYAGKPLYWFVGDTGPGQVNGNVTDSWGKWSAVVTAKAASSVSGGSSSGGSTAGSGGTAF
jgi:predicted lipoprotein with Yx(FWY)xxD motif